MKQINQIKLFISCPGDIKDELDSIRIIINEINKTSGRQNSYLIETINWKDDTYTQVGQDAQEVINNQLEHEYDILIGLMWLRVGTPTKRDKSGTIEEINRAISDVSKEALIYFKTSSPDNLNSINLEELNNVNIFKSELSERGVLYKEFNSIETFESLFRINIINLINDKLLTSPERGENVKDLPVKVNDDKYADLTNAILEIEQRPDSTTVEIDMFELTENINLSLGVITSSLSSMTDSLNYIGEKFIERNKELSNISAIKDDRLRLKKYQIVFDLLTDELSEFNSRMNADYESFSKYFTAIGPMYSQVLLYAPYMPDGGRELRESVLGFRDSIESATRQNIDLLRIMSNFPPISSKFNKVKRETEIVLKNIAKEFLEGLKLIDEAVR